MDYFKTKGYLTFALNERKKGLENINAKIADLERIKNILLNDIEKIESDIKEIENN